MCPEETGEDRAEQEQGRLLLSLAGCGQFGAELFVERSHFSHRLGGREPFKLRPAWPFGQASGEATRGYELPANGLDFTTNR